MRYSSIFALASLLAAVVGSAGEARAQTTGAVAGAVALPDRASAVDAVLVTVRGTVHAAPLDPDGHFLITGIAPGTRTIVFTGLGYRTDTRTVEIVAGATARVDVALVREPVRLAELTVYGASRGPERIAEAPAAIAVVERAATVGFAPTGQVPVALTGVPGVDIVQSGVDEFNVNARGFNSSLNRRMLVLMDGRDLAIPLLGFQEWRAIGRSMADLSTVEVVRGPGSALYGANAYSGVINIRTAVARDAVGTRLSLGGGELGSVYGDLRHAGLFDGERMAYKLNVGHTRSDSWTRSRTSSDRGDLRREYGGAATVPDVMEIRPLFGQRLDEQTRAAIGEPDPITSTYASLRIDRYGEASTATVEGGATLLENTTLVSGIGRIQADRVVRPWGRVAWSNDAVNGSFWYSGRNTLDDPHISLSSGASLVDKSSIIQAEVQGNRRFFNDRLHAVVGTSFRNSRTRTEGTLFDPADDDRIDNYGSAYGQLEFNLTDAVTAVGAMRFDAGALFESQVSPRLALVIAPDDRHSIRFTVHRAFQTPTQLEHFLRVPAGAPADFAPLEAGLRASALGPHLAEVPDGELFTSSASVPVLALGNRNLQVESVTSLEAGYRGQLGGVYLSVDLFRARLTDFVTDLLPGANSEYSAWTAPLGVPEAVRGTIEETVRSQLTAAGQRLAAAGLTRLQNGRTAIVVSYTNAGRATEQGIEIGARVPMGLDWTLHASYTYLDFEIDASSLVAGDVFEPNTPRHKGSIGVSYRQGPLDAGATLRIAEAYDWAAGVFMGPVPARQVVDVRATWHLNANLAFQAVATNLFNQRQYELFGGSVVGRRVLIGLTTAW